MLFTLRSTHPDATDLGYLLEKNPSRTQHFDLSFGRAHVTFPEASAEACTAALYLEIDPLELRAARKASGDEGLLSQYVSDRPYVASSYLAVAIGSVFRSAMAGRSRERQALADTALPLTATLSVLLVRGGEGILERLFGPLSYTVEVDPIALDEQFPSWGPSPYVRLTLRGDKRVSELLTHLTVLIPVLDASKHYYIGEDEVEKLLSRGEGWLAAHPERELIARRYLKRSAHLTRMALARLSELDEAIDDKDGIESGKDEASSEDLLERPHSLNDARIDAVTATLIQLGAQRVLDVGCGEGRLLGRLLRERAFTSLAGMDVSSTVLLRASERLHLDRLSDAERARIQLFHGSLVYGDPRLTGWDAITAIEVIEHLDPFRLGALERVVFAEAKAPRIVLTTPNREYNPRYGLADGQLRHGDHRFEWSRAELADWAQGVARRHGYAVALSGIGAVDPTVGAPTQLAVFTR